MALATGFEPVVLALRGLDTSPSELQYTNVSRAPILDDGFVPSGEYQSFRARGCDQESIRRVPMRLSREESALCGRVGVERQQADAGRGQCASNPIAKRNGKLDSALGMLDADLPHRNGGDSQPVLPPRLFQFLRARRRQAILIAL